MTVEELISQVKRIINQKDRGSITEATEIT